jgi:uncharacterized membrane protein
VVTSALLSAVHVLALAVGLGTVYVRGRALAGSLDESGWRQLLAADNAWGLAAGLWIASGLGRVFFSGKEPAFYPMITFIRVRSSRRRGAAIPEFSVSTYRSLNTIELALVVTIVFVAAFMARGAWLF